MEVTAQYNGGSKFEISARGHRAISDQPRENGGADEGMTPPEYLVAALATCGGYYAVQYLKARGLSLDSVRIHVSAEKAAQPARAAGIATEGTAQNL
jgi:uncharacterized OsmC-like protein